MKAFVVILIVVYVVLAFVGCLDRNSAIEDAHASGKEGTRNEAAVDERCGVHRVDDVNSRVANVGSIAITGSCEE
jgi:hypothetical protein